MGNSPELLVSKLFDFAAAHSLEKPDAAPEENRKIFGDCMRLHGHNYKLEVTVSGPVDKDSGMVINFKILKDVVEKAVISKFDHFNLNTIPEFKGKVPTAENMILIIRDLLEKENLKIKKLRLWETDSCLVELNA